MIGVKLNATKGECRGTRKRRSAGAPRHARLERQQGICTILFFDIAIYRFHPAETFKDMIYNKGNSDFSLFPCQS